MVATYVGCCYLADYITTKYQVPRKQVGSVITSKCNGEARSAKRKNTAVLQNKVATSSFIRNRTINDDEDTEDDVGELDRCSLYQDDDVGRDDDAVASCEDE